ncbi:hypothetical protein PHJA_000717700 [Phtheirospermum japonicum]|uniref:COP1-interacting protein 7 n=1 Tax=Phtheirospermum japonicum TaxID=374723 RepID=A0A830BDS6_9LAMI|nr:hypothetical protein PHJA_000717700 [Phtheirospermum japonicum]
MKSDTPLDYAVFQLSPKHSRCELFVSSDGSTEKIASGLLKPFVSHLQIAEEQLASTSQSFKLEVGRQKNAKTWFTKGTLERFVRFVSTPEVLELVNTFDAEMSQLEAARRIYSQGVGDQHSGGGGSGVKATDDATKKELLRAIDVRLLAVKQDLSTACARAAAAGFNIDTVSELQMFADRFGAHRLNEACSKFVSLSEKRPELVQPSKSGPDDRALRSSYGSDMSIDDDPTSPPPHQEPATFQQPNPAPVTFPLSRTFSREPSVDREESKKPNDTVTEKDRKDESSTPDQTVSISASQPTRRLSVQDRISMFENKQKENSGGKPAVVVKPVELRRLSSDLSASGSVAAEKAVLRRWSGASDMSIDMSADKKDTESPSCTPASSVVSQDKKVSDSNEDTTELSSVAKPELKVSPSLGRVSDSKLRGVSFNNSEMLSGPNKSNSNLGSGENDGLKYQGLGKTTQSRSFVSRAEDQDFSENNHKTSTGGKTEQREELSGSQAQIIGVNDRASSITQIRPFVSKGGEQLEIPNQKEGFESRNESTKQIQKKATHKTAVEPGVLENDAGSKIKRAFASRYKGTEADSSSAQKEVRSVGETEVTEKKAPYMSEKVSSVEDAGPQRLKFNRQAELSKKARVQRDESSFSGNSKAPFSGKLVTEAQEGIDSFSTPPPDQVQRIRPSKGNQELNDELKMKASELERLFAEHKSRAPTDQSNSSSRKGNSGETLQEPSSNLHYTKPVSDIAPQSSDSHQSTEPTRFSKNSTKSNFASPVKTVDAMNKNFSELSIQEGSRGKLYDTYMQKRNAKLREEWSSNGVEKEARLKSMQDSLERNRSEMKTKISGSADRRDSASSAHRRAERLRSYNSRPVLKREQQDLDFVDSDDDEALDFAEQNRLHENTLFRDGVSKGKRHLPNNRSLLSTTPRTSAAPVPKSATKNSANSGKRRMQMENPLAQSVPNFSELRKENAKPSSGASKPTRSQVRNYARSKSTNEEAANIAREDNKSRRSQSLRKSSANPSDFGEMSTLDSDCVNLTPIKFDVEVMKTVAPKPFLKKGSRASFVSQTSIAREKASLVSEFIKNEDENDDDVESGPDEFASAGKTELDEEFEDLNTEDQNIFNNGEPKQGVESEKLIKSESENGDITNRALESQLPTVDSMQDWPEESPVSWNYTHRQNPFSYPHEMSDVDASVDSPGGSPASWNSNSFNQIETDSSRMRKKWGTAQKPMLVAQSSNNLPRKDMKTGFKRLLKFGRKSRGSDILVDWISATTSEGDDDTEDGRDPAYRSSEDLRKSRMGFSHAQPSEDSYNESEFFNESDYGACFSGFVDDACLFFIRTVQSSQISIPAAPANFKLRDEHMSGSSIKGARFSISRLHHRKIDKHYELKGGDDGLFWA